ncbi:MAG: TIGR02646 family protein [Bacteroidia bacterium]|nr:TIGR02646 family protein [Bacteroidia bacterium]
MKDIRFIFKDNDFIQEAEVFNQKYFRKNNRRLIQLYYRGQPIQSKDFDSSWTELKGIFWKKQGKRCCLCEKELNDVYTQHIEHYRPKFHYWWMAYHYKNYYLACAECNTKYKRTQFPLVDENQRVHFHNRKQIHLEKPLLINPILDDPSHYFELYFTIHETSGKKVIILKPWHRLPKNSTAYQKAQQTIAVLNLDLHQWLETRHELMRCFYLQLIGLAQNRLSLNKEDFKKYWKKFKAENPEISTLGLTKLVLKGQFKIAGFLR